MNDPGRSLPSSASLLFSAVGRSDSVALRPDHPLRTWFTGERTRAGSALVVAELLAVEGDAADRHREVVLDPLLELRVAVEVGHHEARMNWGGLVVGSLGRLEELVERLFGVDDVGVRLAECLCPRKKSVLDLLEDVRGSLDEVLEFETLLVLRSLVAAGHEDVAFRDVTRPDFQTDRGATLDPLPRLVAAAEIAGVVFHFDHPAAVDLGLERLDERLAERHDLVLRLGLVEDGLDHDVRGRDHRGTEHTVVVGVGHDRATDQPGAHAPAGRPAEFAVAFVVLELDLLGLGKVLPEEVTGAGLQRFAILHHRFDAPSLDRAGEAFAFGLLATDHRHREPVLREVGVDVEHLHRLGLGFLVGGVGGVTLLPEELRGAEEHAGPHLPTDDVGPLVDQQRKVAMALDPLGKGRADDHLAGGANDEGLFELARGHEATVGTRFQPVMGDHRALLGEAVDVLGLLLQE